ncbi:hypothetical protein BpHYR1_028903 [Brachionus plicatilis]|uniref:Uncharacterized protein n=1 Tax=Brachionus plicatilis TaxID=10195 RepID=A0A3M7RZR8_BRAPC|nr:hypothetical protein BpHYR1_028903 [Brachionus plicatilis]
MRLHSVPLSRTERFILARTTIRSFLKDIYPFLGPECSFLYSNHTQFGFSSYLFSYELARYRYTNK